MSETKKKGNGLNYKRTFLIGFGFMGCMLMWSVYNSYVPVIFGAKLTEITNGGAALPGILSVALLVNAIMTIDNIFGVIFQPFFGKRSDSTHTKWGKRMPYIITCLPICALFFSLIPVAATIKAGVLSIALMMAVIIFFNFTMSVWRSPVVSLMPDFTPSHLQSDANAVINIMGGVGQMIGFIIGTIATTLVGLLGFTAMHDALKAKTNSLGQILQVNADGSPVVKYFNNFNPELAEYKEHVENFIASGRDKLYLNNGALSGTGEEKNLVAQKVAAVGADGNPMYVNYAPIFIVAAVVSILCLVVLVIFYKRNKQYDLSKDIVIEKENGEKAKKIKIKDLPISKEERRSLLVMLAALFLINNATEAIVPNFTNFALDTLNVKPIYSTLMMAVFAVSLAAFGIPAGAMGRKLGRKKTIIIGLSVIVVMFIIYLAVSQFVTNRQFTWIVLWIALVVGGAAVGCININTLPLVLAIGGRDYVGTFTGYYYTATFSAAITGPILCGGLIGLFGEDYNYMFLFCAIMFAIGLGVITQVRHGESSKDEDTSWIDEAVENAD
ncbi:MAG: MFS transporter [Clostridiales bacterium]|nr:MFS transporter [Clostridiales bacterium]